jgi:hypothetical protein
MDLMSFAILANSAINRATDGQIYNSDFTKLLQEVSRASDSLKGKISAIEQIVIGQVLAHSDAAKIALNNSLVFEGKKKQAEILRASQLLELCYAEMLNTPILGGYKAEVAFCLAMTHALLAVNEPERKVLMNEWIVKSYRDFKLFIKTPEPEGITTQEKVVMGAGIFGSIGGAPILITALSTGLGIPISLAILVVSATSVKAMNDTNDKVDAKEKLQKLYQKQIKDAKAAVVELEQIIASLNQGSLPQIEE